MLKLKEILEKKKMSQRAKQYGYENCNIYTEYQTTSKRHFRRGNLPFSTFGIPQKLFFAETGTTL